VTTAAYRPTAGQRRPSEPSSETILAPGPCAIWRTGPAAATSPRCGSPLALRMAEVTIRLEGLFESPTTLDAGRNFAGLRVRVRRLPIEVRSTPSIGLPLVHLPAVLTHSAVSPVDAEPTYDFVPKYEIIWHMLSHIFIRPAGKQPASSSREPGPG